MDRAWMTRGVVMWCAVASSASRAGPPAVLDVVPTDRALAVVAVGSVEAADGRLTRLARSAGWNGYGGIEAALVAMGIRRGLDLSGSAGLVLFGPAEAGGRMRWALVAPVSDGGVFLEGVGAVEEGESGRFEYAGVRYATRRIGARHIALSEDESVLVDWRAVGAPGGIVERVGSLGRETLGEADVVMVAGAGGFEALEQWFAGRRGVVPGAGTSALGRMWQTARAEAHGVIAGLSFETWGLRFEACAGFVDDGVTARVGVAGLGEMRSIMTDVPALPYLAAVGIDASHPGVRALAEEFGPPGRVDSIAASGERLVLGLVPSWESLGAVVYEPPSVMFGSLSRLAVVWRSPTPEESVSAFGAWLASLDGRLVRGSAVRARMEAGGSWMVTPPTGAWAMQPMLLGSSDGIRGVIESGADDGFVTWSRDEGLITALRGVEEPASLGGDAFARAALARMPAGRSVEGLVDVGFVTRLVGPMLGQAPGGGEAAERLPPIGVSFEGRDGSLRVRVDAPLELMRVIAGLAERADDETGASGRGRAPR